MRVRGDGIDKAWCTHLGLARFAALRSVAADHCYGDGGLVHTFAFDSVPLRRVLLQRVVATATGRRLPQRNLLNATSWTSF